MQGIYQYIDKKTNEIVYIGKDNHINEKRRYNAHLAPSHYNIQPFNRVLQNNPDRYQYEVVYAGDFDNNLLNALEINSIAEFKLKNNGNKPKFNFTDGGEGICGFTHSEETKKKISEANTGKNNPNYRNPNNYRHSEETKKKISKALAGRRFSEEHLRKLSEAHTDEKHYLYGKHRSEETKKKLSKINSGENNPAWKDYARIIKIGKNNKNKQQYAIKYQGKRIKYSISIDKLKQWFSIEYPNEELIIPKVIFNE